MKGGTNGAIPFLTLTMETYPMNKVLIALVVLFFGFWMFTDPSGLADATGAAGGQVADWGSTLFGAVIDFFGEL